MFNQLLESSGKKQRSVGGTVVSVVFHSLIGAAAVWATANAAIEKEEPKPETVTYVEVARKVEEPPPPEAPKDAPPASQDQVYTPPPPKGFQVLTAPVEIPDVIPDVDLTRKVTNEADFSGKGVAGGVARGVVGGTGPITSENTTYFEFQVERPAMMDRDRSPRPVYPSALQSAGIEGSVKVQFVVDTSGRAEMGSLKILESSNELFTLAVRNVMPKLRFFPAEVGGRKVRQLVQLPFNFTIER
jgi:protein TonB